MPAPDGTRFRAVTVEDQHDQLAGGGNDTGAASAPHVDLITDLPEPDVGLAVARSPPARLTSCVGPGTGDEVGEQHEPGSRGAEAAPLSRHQPVAHSAARVVRGRHHAESVGSPQALRHPQPGARIAAVEIEV